MKIVILTAGTGSFHCGTCMRDNALVVELRRQGHDAVLVPMYLPPILDEEGELAPLFYGGINVYLQQKSALFRKSPRWLDRLFDSPGALKAAARRSGSMTSAAELGDLTLSMLRGEEGRQRKELERLAEWLRELRPEVVVLSNALLLGLGPALRRATGAPVVCMMTGEDTFLDSLPEGQREEAWAGVARLAGEMDACIAISRYYADLMRARAGIPDEKMRVVHAGINLEGFAPGEPPPVPTIGYLARMCYAKGLHTLVDAFIALRRRGKVPDTVLRAAGSQTAADAEYVATLRDRLEKAGLSEAAAFTPNISREEKIRFLQGLTILSVPATYGESFGLYVVEAMAAGVPLVQPRHAAFPELLEATGAGILVEPDDPEALAAGLEELLLDPARARSLGAAGRRAAEERFTVERMARRTLAVLQDVTRG